MSEETKTYVFGNEGNSIAPLLAAMNNGGFGGNGAWWPLIFLFALWGGNGFGGNGWGNRQGTETILQTLNGDQGRDMLMSAINGNSTAISQLASTVGCEFGQVQSALSNISSSLCQLSNTVGMSGQQIINSIQAGNAALASKLSECCCENKLLVTQQGYENRISNQEQTNFLSAKIDYQTNVINDKFCQLEMREMQNKIDTLREEKSILQNTISNANQTAAIQSYVASVVNPIAADVAAIKAAQPPTVAVPYPQLSAVPQSYLCALNANGIGPWGFFGNNGSIWS